MFSDKKFTDIYKLTPNAAKARDNGDFTVFENIYNEKTLKAAEKIIHNSINRIKFLNKINQINHIF